MVCPPQAVPAWLVMSGVAQLQQLILTQATRFCSSADDERHNVEAEAKAPSAHHSSKGGTLWQPRDDNGDLSSFNEFFSSIAKLKTSLKSNFNCLCMRSQFKQKPRTHVYIILSSPHVLVPLGEGTCLLGGVPASDLLLTSEGDFAKLLSAAACRSGPLLDVRFWYGLPLL